MKINSVFAFAAAALLATPSFALQPKQVITGSNHVKMVVSPKASGAGADLLFVVDDSASMDRYQQKLATNMPALATALKGKASLHAAVTTSSMTGISGSCAGPCTDGKFITTPAVLSSDDTDFIAALMKGIPAGTLGSGTEEFFSPVLKALTPPLSETTNAGFLREGAHLAVVMLTDGEDQSMMTPADLITGLEAIKGKGNFTVFGFIIPSASTTPNCDRDDGGSTPVKIEEAIKLTGGESYDLCGADYSSALQQIGGAVMTTLERTIRLPLTPVAGSVTVQYGSLTLMPGDIHNGWTYDSTINAIVLGDAIDFASLPVADLVINFDY
jgi:hypothetical protein